MTLSFSAAAGAGSIAIKSFLRGPTGPQGAQGPTANDSYPYTATVGTDIGVALNAFMVNVADVLGGGTVTLPPGAFTTSVQIIVPHSVKLKGAGKRTTTITAIAPFPVATAVIRLGRAVTDVPTFDCTLEDIFIDCAAISSSIGVYSKDANEGCGCFHVIVENFKDTGIFYDAGCEHFRNEDLEVTNTNSSSNYCIKAIGSGFPSGICGPIEFDRITVSGFGVGNTTACIWLKNCAIQLQQVHMESSTDGLLIDGDNVSGVISGIDGSVQTNVVRFTGASPVVVLGLFGLFSFTNLVKDDVTGLANNSFYMPALTRYPTLVNSLPVTITSATTYVILETDTVIILNFAGTTSIALPTASLFTGRVIHFKGLLQQLCTSTLSNVVPLAGGAAGTAILPAIIGAWATLKSNGTNWVIIASSPGPIPLSLAGSTWTFTGTLNITGSFSTGGTLSAGTAQYIQWTASTAMRAPSDGTIVLTNQAETDFSLMQYGGTTSSFPAVKRVSAALETRLADDSARAQHNVQIMALTDGITAPTQTSGLAKIYVDTTDGDLKVIFGDGVIKTIVVDT